MSNSLDLSEKPSYSASHPDVSCLHMELQLCLAGLGLTNFCLSLMMELSKSYFGSVQLYCNRDGSFPLKFKVFSFTLFNKLTAQNQIRGFLFDTLNDLKKVNWHRD